MPTWLLLVLGFTTLVAGAELLVRGSASLALRLGVPSLLVGLTVVAWGTSSPELVVSLRAALRGSPSIALGNVVGSNISNILLILGLAAVIRPLGVQVQLVRRDVPILIVLSAVLLAMALGGSVSRPEGGALLVAAILYTGFAFWQARGEKPKIQEDVIRAAPVPERPTRGVWRDGVFILGGLSALAGGAELFVRGAVEMASALGVSEAVIGLTIVAVGTSLPELATSIVAARRNQGDLAIGNVVGSNIFNIVGILGATAIVQPLVGAEVGLLDLGVALAAPVLLLPLLVTGFRLTRREGALLVTLYAAYIYVVLV